MLLWVLPSSLSLPFIFENVSFAEQIAHGCSFLVNGLSDSLTSLTKKKEFSDSLMVAHFLWVTWGIRSGSLICLERSERIAHSRSFDLREMSKWANEQWANEQIPSPDLLAAGSHYFVIFLWHKTKKCTY